MRMRQCVRARVSDWAVKCMTVAVCAQASRVSYMLCASLNYDGKLQGGSDMDGACTS